MDIYKCPKSIFGNTFGNQKPSFLYILTIFLLKEYIITTFPHKLRNVVSVNRHNLRNLLNNLVLTVIIIALGSASHCLQNNLVISI
jgi:hypothetical protein